MDQIANLKKLHEDIYQCSICNSKRNKVFRVQPPWDEKLKTRSIHKWAMFVGQAPGKTELKKSQSAESTGPQKVKIPFSGPSRKNLEKWFKREGVDLAVVFETLAKTSLIKCYPGKVNGGDRKPTKTEIRNCEPFLIRQIELIKPKLIIAIGKEAIQWFLPNEDYEDALGKIADPGVFKVVCLPHPSPANNGFTGRKEIIEKIASSIRLIDQEWRKYGLGKS